MKLTKHLFLVWTLLLVTLAGAQTQKTTAVLQNNQTFSGVNTFNPPPILSRDPLTAFEAVPKHYADTYFVPKTYQILGSSWITVQNPTLSGGSSTIVCNAASSISGGCISNADYLSFSNKLSTTIFGAPNTWTAAQTGPFIDSGANVIDVRSKGAVCDGTTNDYAAINAAITSAVAIHGTVKLPDGKTCAYATALNINAGYWGMFGGNGSTLKYTGAGIALLVDGTGITNGAGNVSLRDFAIQATTGTNCAYFKKMARSDIRNIDCRGTAGVAFVVDFGVSNLFTNLSASSNLGAFTATPTGGVLLTNASGGASTDNTFVNPKMEGIAGIGIDILGSNGNVFVSGASEGNTGASGKGIRISGTSVSNTFIGTDVESNAGTHDVELVDGTTVRGTQFINMTVGRDLMVGTASKETSIHGGNITTVTVNAGAAATLLDGGVRYSTLTDNGNGTNRIGENAAVSNTLSITKSTSVAGTGTATFAAGASAGTSPGTPTCTTSHICDSYSGTVSFTMGTATTTGVALTITTSITRTNQPTCVGTMYLAASPFTRLDTRLTETTTTVVFNTGTAPAASTAYELTYVCGGN